MGAVEKKGKTVLVVDDQEPVRKIVKLILENDGYEVVTEPDGAAAQQRLRLEDFNCIVTDIQMGEAVNSGVALLRFVNENKKIPVILMTGFSHILEVQEAHRLGAYGFLAKPFKKEELLKLVSECCALEKSEEPSKKSQDDEYCKVSIEDFLTGKSIHFGIYVRLSSTQYTKIAHEGADLSLDLVRTLQKKGVYFLYLLRADFRIYIRLSLAMGRPPARSTVSDEKKAEWMKHTAEVFFNSIYSTEIEPESFTDAKSIVENVVAFLLDTQETAELLFRLDRNCDYLYAHSLGVSLYSVLIARKRRWLSGPILFRLAIAGLFHDIGFESIDPPILSKTKLQMSVEEKKAFEKHPIRGKEILSGIPNLPSEIGQAILHHHERDRGVGYPEGLSKSKIQPLARIIAVADEFCERVIKNPNSTGGGLSSAASELMVTGGLDQELVQALAQAIGK